MSLTNEDLLAISQLLDAKLKPLEDRTKNIQVDMDIVKKVVSEHSERLQKIS